uniref:Uncharacterized protein n=1 Tax=Sphaerodactylus townsendi TaxID=933632 RepID=A0ACB8FUN7_9SAUR
MDCFLESLQMLLLLPWDHQNIQLLGISWCLFRQPFFDTVPPGTCSSSWLFVPRTDKPPCPLLAEIHLLHWLAFLWRLSKTPFKQFFNPLSEPEDHSPPIVESKEEGE